MPHPNRKRWEVEKHPLRGGVMGGVICLLTKPVFVGEMVQGRDWISDKVNKMLSGVRG